MSILIITVLVLVLAVLAVYVVNGSKSSVSEKIEINSEVKKVEPKENSSEPERVASEGIKKSDLNEDLLLKISRGINYQNELLSVIKMWVQFFGIITIVSIVLSFFIYLYYINNPYWI